MAEALHELGAREAADRVRRAELRATDLVAGALERIALLDPDLHSFITVCDDEARETAAAIDRLVAAGTDPGPLAGVPIGVKDIIATIERRERAFE